MPLNAQTAKFVVAKKISEQRQHRRRTTTRAGRCRRASMPTSAGSVSAA